MFPLAIGAVVVGEPTTFQIPLSGQLCSADALVPMATLSFSTPPVYKLMNDKLIGIFVVCMDTYRILEGLFPFFLSL